VELLDLLTLLGVCLLGRGEPDMQRGV